MLASYQGASANYLFRIFLEIFKEGEGLEMLERLILHQYCLNSWGKEKVRNIATAIYSTVSPRIVLKKQILFSSSNL